MNPEQHRTPNAEMSKDSRCHSMFGVGCSMLDVPRVHGEGRGEGENDTDRSLCVRIGIGEPCSPLGPHGFEPFMISYLRLCRTSLTKCRIVSQNVPSCNRVVERKVPFLIGLDNVKTRRQSVERAMLEI